MTDDEDIIARIDAQLAEGEPRTGYDYNDPTYPTCPRCGRHWHGMPITRRIEYMHRWGQFDPDYRFADDDSEILCEGPDFIGPRRPTQTEQAWANATPERRSLRDISFGIVFDEVSTERWRAAVRHVSEAFERMAAVWFCQPEQTAPLCLSSAPAKITFGPENWVRKPEPQQYLPMRRPSHIRTYDRHGQTVWAGIYRRPDPLSDHVSELWPEFTALPADLTPSRPGFDFTRYNAEENHGPTVRRRRTTTAHLPQDNWTPPQQRRRRRTRRAS